MRNNKKLFFTLVVSLALFFSFGLTTFDVYASSDVEFPAGWEDWPIISTGVIPGSEEPVSRDLPKIIQETYKTYNWINDGKGSVYNVRVHPDKMEEVMSDTKDFSDGVVAIIEFTEIKVFFVTEILLGDALYGIYTFDGTDMEGAHESLKKKTCIICHTSYVDFFESGVTKRAVKSE